MEKPIVVKDQAAVDAFKALGIDAVIKGADAPDTTVSELNAKIDTLQKAVTEKDAEIAELKKGVQSQGTGAPAVVPADLSAKLDAVGTLSKALLDAINGTNESVEKLSKSFNETLEEMKDDIQKIGIESQPRVAGGVALKKAFEVDEKSGKKVLSKAAHGKQIIEFLDTLSESETANKELYTDAVVRFETSRSLTKAVELDLAANHDIIIVE